MLADSNGAGGFHLWTFFEEPAPLRDVHHFVQQVVSDWEGRNLDAVPETFPKSGELSGNKLGAWLRVPGLHHTHDQFTRVWSGEDWLDDPWLEGRAAIEVFLKVRPGPPPPAAPGGELAPKPKRTRKRGKGQSVCVDLDGVLSHYDGWQGVEHFGDPISGAVDFTKSLSQIFRVVIFTARLHGSRDQEVVLPLVQGWLDRHGFAYDEIYTGSGKPFATAYIDDRGLSCRPQDEGVVAFERALANAKLLEAKKKPVE